MSPTNSHWLIWSLNERVDVTFEGTGEVFLIYDMWLLTQCNFWTFWTWSHCSGSHVQIFMLTSTEKSSHQMCIGDPGVAVLDTHSWQNHIFGNSGKWAAACWIAPTNTTQKGWTWDMSKVGSFSDNRKAVVWSLCKAWHPEIQTHSACLVLVLASICAAAWLLSLATEK